MSCGVDCRHGSDPAFLWLWQSPASMALIGPLVWEAVYVMSVDPKIPKKKNEKQPGGSVQIQTSRPQS